MSAFLGNPCPPKASSDKPGWYYYNENEHGPCWQGPYQRQEDADAADMSKRLQHTADLESRRS